MTPLTFSIIGIILIVLAIAGLLKFSYGSIWGFNVMAQMRYLLEDTIKHYSTAYNRAVNESGGCEYRTPTLKTCALGHRFYRYDSSIEGCLPDNENSKERLDNYIDPIYRNVPMDFWNELQTFHDTTHFWREGGLTVDGASFAERIRVRFAL